MEFRMYLRGFELPDEIALLLDLGILGCLLHLGGLLGLALLGLALLAS